MSDKSHNHHPIIQDEVMDITKKFINSFIIIVALTLYDSSVHYTAFQETFVFIGLFFALFWAYRFKHFFNQQLESSSLSIVYLWRFLRDVTNDIMQLIVHIASIFFSRIIDRVFTQSQAYPSYIMVLFVILAAIIAVDMFNTARQYQIDSQTNATNKPK